MGRGRAKPKGKKIRPTLFVFCEGKTEELYVKFLRSCHRIPIELDAKVAENRISAKHIANYKKTRSVHKKDGTFLMYDLDAPKMLEKLRTIKGTVLLASNPCIELWYLLHYKAQTASITCADCNRELTKRNKHYSKTVVDEKLRATLQTKQSKAMERAKKLTKYANPSSTVYLLIETLEKAKNETE